MRATVASSAASSAGARARVATDDGIEVTAGVRVTGSIATPTPAGVADLSISSATASAGDMRAGGRTDDSTTTAGRIGKLMIVHLLVAWLTEFAKLPIDVPWRLSAYGLHGWHGRCLRTPKHVV